MQESPSAGDRARKRADSGIGVAGGNEGGSVPGVNGTVGDEVDVLSMAVRRPSIVAEGGGGHVRHTTLDNLVSAPASMAGTAVQSY